MKNRYAFGPASSQDVDTSRRSVLKRTAAAAATPWLAAIARASTLKHVPIGFQTWSVREQMKSTPLETLTRLSKVGFQEIEWFDFATNQDAIGISRNLGFKLVSLHFWNLFEETGEWESWLAAGMPSSIPGFDVNVLAAQCKKYGFKYAVYSSDAVREARTTLDGALKFCSAANLVGKQMAERGIRFLLHPEPALFTPIGDTTLYDLLVDHTDPRFMGFELDVFWIAYIGRDPVKELRRLGARTELLHVKDRKRGVPPVKPGTDAPDDASLFVPVGTGSLDFPTILRTAKAGGTQHFFLEQDESIGDPVLTLAKSYSYVEKLMSAL